MGKIKYILIIFLMMLPICVKADHIYSIDMDIHIEKDGTANITEVWDVKADSGSEWYKTMYDLGESKFYNYEVYMDGDKLNYKNNWNVNGSLSSKAGYYGINYSIDGMEICFGKNDMKRHKFTLKYTLSNYIFNTSDSQILYWTLIPKITVDSFTVDITSYYKFPDTIDVWGYGYKGYAYVKGGRISMSEDKKLENDYVVLLAKFPLNTFDTGYSMSEFNTFNDVYKMAKKGTLWWSGLWGVILEIRDVIVEMIVSFIGVVFPIFLVLLPYVGLVMYDYFIPKKEINIYGYINNKKVNKKEVPMFRDIPCNKDIYYANILIKLNEFNYKKSNILGAIMLKWIRNDVIIFDNSEETVIKLGVNPLFDSSVERRLFEILKLASKDGVLETMELENWAKNNYKSFLKIFDDIEGNMINCLMCNNHIRKRNNTYECNREYVMDDKIYNDSIELYGLKKYLEEFSKIDTKEVMDVKLWDEYLMFAYLFGIADKVMKQLKYMYPEMMIQNNIDYEIIDFIGRISVESSKSAQRSKGFNDYRQARRATSQHDSGGYSSGGGGRSHSGGGGGSRGGGSRGSAGGR